MTDETAPTQPTDVTRPAPAAPPPTQPTDVTRPAPAAPPPEPPPASPAAPPQATGRTPLGVLRSVAVGLVFVLACLSLVLATTGFWVGRTFTNTDAFVAAAAPVAEDPAVQEALAQVAADQVTQAFDLGPLGRYVAVGISREIFGSDAFVKLWDGALRVAHTALIAVLRDDANRIDMVDGQVYVNLFPFIDRVLERLGTLDLSIRGRPIVVPDISDPSDPAASRAELEAALGRQLSPTFGVIPVARGDRLVAAQQVFAVAELGIVVLGGLTLLLGVLTVLLARRRLRMIALLGVGALASLLLARLGIAVVQDAVADAVAGTGNGAVIADQVVAALADSYRELTGIALLGALVAAVVATAIAWTLDRRMRAEDGTPGETAIADGWFLAFAGLCIALAALILVGLTLASLAIVALAYLAWLAAIVLTRRRAKSRATAAAA